MRINGLKVVDLKHKIALHITPNDVAKGATKDPGACAAALCIKQKQRAAHHTVTGVRQHGANR